LTGIDGFLIKSIWGDAPCDYSYQLSVGASGGLIMVWDSSIIEVWSSMSFGHVLVIKGSYLNRRRYCYSQCVCAL